MISIAQLSAGLDQSVRVTRHWIDLGIIEPTYGEKYAKGRLINFTLDETRWAFLAAEMARAGHDLVCIAAFLKSLRADTPDLFDKAISQTRNVVLTVDYLTRDQIEAGAFHYRNTFSIPFVSEIDSTVAEMMAEDPAAALRLMLEMFGRTEGMRAVLQINLTEVFRCAKSSYFALCERDASGHPVGH